MGAVDERLDAPLPQGGDEAFDREDERRRARDVVEERQARPGRDGVEDRRDDVVLSRDGEGDGGHDDAGPGPRGDELHRLPAGGVDVGRREQLVAGVEARASGGPR